jgi:cytochrome-b5 reductase
MFARLFAPRALRAAAAATAGLAAGAGLASSASSSSASSTSSASSSASSASSAVALSPAEFRPFRLLAREQLTPDTSRFSFALPSESAELGVPVAGCLTVRVPDPADPAKFVVRPYTPTSPAGARGAFELVVKTYEPGGKVSRAFGALKVGESLEMKGPFVKFAYEANAQAALALVAGGTGITPMLQLIRAVLANPRDRTEVRLVYASKTPADVILKAELDALALAHPNFKVLYTVSKVPAGAAPWPGAVGHVTKEMLASFLPPPQAAGGAKVVVCGPPGFMRAVSGEKKSPSDQGELAGMLKELKFEPGEVFKM